MYVYIPVGPADSSEKPGRVAAAESPILKGKGIHLCLFSFLTLGVYTVKNMRGEEHTGLLCQNDDAPAEVPLN